MNEFAEALSGTFEVSHRIFGETCSIGGSPFDCIIHLFRETDEVDRNRAGRSKNIDGMVTMTRLDWITANGRKGIHITLPNGEYRVMNDPLSQYETHTVELLIGSLS